MATPTIQRIMPPRAPGNFDYHETVPTVSDGSFNLNFRNGELFTITPTLATPNSNYTSKGMRVSLNAGQTTPADLTGSQRSFFAKAGTIQDAAPRNSDGSLKRNPDGSLYGFNQYTKEDCYRVAQIMWAAKGPFGFVCGEAQEDTSIYRFQTDFAPQQVKWVYEGLQILASQHVEITNGGLVYCDSSTIWYGKSGGGKTADFATIVDGLSSTAKARAPLAAFEWGFYNYWSGGLFETGTAPLINGYIVHNDCWLQYWQTVLKMELTAVANVGAFSDPRTMTLFGWVRSQAGLDPYTEAYAMNFGGGVNGIGRDFVTADPNLQMKQVRRGLRHGKYVYLWDNPYLYGTDTQYLCQADERTQYTTPTTGRQLINKINPAPYKAANAPYPHAQIPYGYVDLGPVAAKMHCLQTDFLNKRPTAVAWNVDGANPIQPDNSYIARCIDNHLPHVEAAVEGNRAIVDIYQPEGNGGHLTVQLGGSFGDVTIEYWPGVDNQFHLQL